MLVYRIETNEGKGIYSAGYGHKFTAAALAENSRDLWHPSPDEEPAIKDFWEGNKLSRSKRIDWQLKGRNAWFCGFESMEQLLEWFPKEGLHMMWNAMMRHGRTGQIITYKIPANQVKRGERQVIFRLDKAEKVSSIALERFATSA